MPKLDFFSGQPDDAKAAQEDSSASGQQWEDAFAGMQKLDLFEEPSVAGGAAQPAAGAVPPAVPGAVQQPGVTAAVPAPQEESKANQTGRAIFENLFSAEEEEEEVLMPPQTPVAAQPEPAIPDVILPGTVNTQPMEPVVQAQPAVTMPTAQPVGSVPAVEPAQVQPQILPTQQVIPAQEGAPQVQPQAIQSIPVEPIVQPQASSAAEHAPAADAASVPVFAQEETQEQEPQQETESMFPKEEPRRVSKAKPINWHVNILEEKEKEAAARAAAQAAAAQAALERTTSSIPPVASAAPAEEVEPIRSSKPPVQTVIQGEKPAWMPLLETAMTEKGLTPPVYDETATTKVFTPAPKKKQQQAQPVESAQPVQPAPVQTPSAPQPAPAAEQAAVKETPKPQTEKPPVSSVTTEIPLLSDFDDLPPVGQTTPDQTEGFGALFSDDLPTQQADPLNDEPTVKKDPDKMKDIASGIAATFGDGFGEDLTNDPANLFSSDPTETVERAPVHANQSMDDFYSDDLQEDPFANENVQREKDYPGTSNEGNRKMLIFVGLAAALLVVLIAAYFIFFSGDSTPASTSSGPASGAMSSSTASMPASTATSDSLAVSSSVAAAEAIPRDEWYMQLVNRQNVLEESFAPPELTTVGGVQVDSRIAEPLQQMIDAASSAGIDLKLTAGYRSYAKQKAAYNNGNGTSDCPPGASEHNLGLSADIQSSTESSYNASAFEATPAYTWLKENAATYGFILRYPKDKESVTGFTYEPWHYRYVGTDQAQKINASGLCFEEYLQQNP